MPASPRPFRFALYGRAGAGKTSFLAAMAAPHATRAGVACTWRGTPADAPRPAGAEAGWAADDPAVAAFRGAEWLRAAVAALAAGAVPPANPLDAPELRLRFDLSTDGVAYPIEVIDYPGEWLDPAAAADVRAARLRDRLRAFDGLLVLAEAPVPGAPPAAPAGELHRLQQAFALIDHRSRAAGAAVALVVNKWDRRGGPADEDAVAAFLAGPDGAMHRTLADALRPADPDGFRAFAASAFGRTRADADGERPPAEGPLPSVGLEEPFLWAARRARARNVARSRARRWRVSGLIAALVVICVAAWLVEGNARRARRAESDAQTELDRDAQRVAADKQAELDRQGKERERERDETDRKLNRDLADALFNGDLLRAAPIVEQFPDERKAEARRTFADAAMRTCEERKAAGLRESHWTTNAREFVAKVHRDDTVRRLLTAEELARVAEMAVELKLAREDALYQQLKANPTAEVARAYLTESPFRDADPDKHVPDKDKDKHKLRRDAATALEKTFTARSGEMEVTVALERIDWGKEGWDRVTNTVEVWVNKSGDRSIANGAVKSAKGTSTPDIGQFQFKGKLDDLLEIRIEVTATSGTFIASKPTQGSGTLTKRIRDLIATQELDLQRLGNKAYLRITAGVPVDPALPE